MYIINKNLLLHIQQQFLADLKSSFLILTSSVKLPIFIPVDGSFGSKIPFIILLCML